jgi:ABC-type phosphate transport system substrate-binding protein
LRSNYKPGGFPGRWALALALTAFVLVAGTSIAVERPEFVVIVNVANPVTSLSAEHASRIFLKKVTSWEDGQAVLPVDQPERSSVRIAFTRQILRRQFAAVNAYWQQRIFSGRELPPLVKDSDAEIVVFVATHPTAIGYVNFGTALGEKIRAVEITGASR